MESAFGTFDDVCHFRLSRTDVEHRSSRREQTVEFAWDYAPDGLRRLRDETEMASCEMRKESILVNQGAKLRDFYFMRAAPLLQFPATASIGGYRNVETRFRIRKLGEFRQGQSQRFHVVRNAEIPGVEEAERPNREFVLAWSLG